MTKRRSSFQEIESWLERAEKEHVARPFRAILSTQNPRNIDQVIIAEDLIESGHELWTIPQNPVTPREAVEIAQAIAPLLRIGRDILFVDPYFRPDKGRFFNVIEACSSVIWNERYGVERPQVEIHTGIDQFFQPYEKFERRNSVEEERVRRNLISECKEKLPCLIPPGQGIHVNIWKEKIGGDDLHNRYLLTDVGGVAFGAGTDESGSRRTKGTDNITLLSKDQFVHRWEQFKATPSAFERVGSPLALCSG